MKSVAGGIILAIILFVAGAALWDEAKTTRRLAQAHERLSVLRYDAGDNLDEGWQLLNRLPVDVGSTNAEVARHRATVSYWLGRYQSLTDMISGRTSAPLDSHLLFLAANATFREAATQPLDKKTAVERLDSVIQSYTEVLRRDSGHADAAFNYELVSRMRDTIAKAPAGRPRPIKAPDAPAAASSFDLPAGPTIHGRPGGPPEGTDMSDFKTITPMRYDEREEQMDPGRGQQIRRKG